MNIYQVFHELPAREGNFVAVIGINKAVESSGPGSTDPSRMIERRLRTRFGAPLYPKSRTRRRKRVIIDDRLFGARAAAADEWALTSVTGVAATKGGNRVVIVKQPIR